MKKSKATKAESNLNQAELKTRKKKSQMVIEPSAPEQERQALQRDVNARSADTDVPALAHKHTKQAMLLDLLHRPEGISIQKLMDVSGWQKHSVHGFLAGTVRKKLGLTLVAEKNEEGVRLYRVVRAAFLFTDEGTRLVPSSTVKDGCRYRYYVEPDAERADKSGKALRLPAGDLERLVLDGLIKNLEGRTDLTEPTVLSGLCSVDPARQKNALMQVVEQITVGKTALLLRLKGGERFRITYHFAASGTHRTLVEPGHGAEGTEGQKKALLKSLVQGTIWRMRLLEGGISLNALAAAEGKTAPYVARHIQFSLMAPDLVRRILRGDVPAHVMREKLIYDWPISWAEQRRLFQAKA